MVNFDDESHTPAEQWLRFMESLPDDKGVWEMSRIPMSSASNEKLDDERLLQDQMECVSGVHDDKVKSLYKSKSVIAVNQHRKTVSSFDPIEEIVRSVLIDLVRTSRLSIEQRMYPVGEEIAKKHGLKPDRHFSEQGWNSSVEDTWPKLLHYRVRTCT